MCERLSPKKKMKKMKNGKSPAHSNGQDLMRGEGLKTIGTTSWMQEKGLSGGCSSPDNSAVSSGASIFDPVLCEVIYRWFCIKDGSILDPFAGGSVRGIVASKLGYSYTGIELRGEQVEANKIQGEEICDLIPPLWINGDSRSVAELVGSKSFDLIFSCPPYGDLEVYSDKEEDLSTLDHSDFIKQYRTIIHECVSLLKDNRFACFVVGDFRDKKGFYRNFVSDTISAFQDAGALLYNEAILITSVGSLPIRAGKQFQSGRKLGKGHQNVLVFFKGNPKEIHGIYGDVGIPDDTFADGNVAIATQFGEVL